MQTDLTDGHGKLVGKCGVNDHVGDGVYTQTRVLGYYRGDYLGTVKKIAVTTYSSEMCGEAVHSCSTGPKSGRACSKNENEKAEADHKRQHERRAKKRSAYNGNPVAKPAAILNVSRRGENRVQKKCYN